MWRDEKTPDPVFTDTLELDLGDVEPASPGRSARRTACRCPRPRAQFVDQHGPKDVRPQGRPASASRCEGTDYDLGHGDVVIAAITSCTNTSNPSVMLAAGLVARKAVEHGPEGQAVGEDLAGAGLAGGHRLSEAAGLQKDLDALGFNLVGYGCTTCIGNSGPLPEPIAKAINDGDLVVVAVLSGNRNFEGRVNPRRAPTTSPRRRWWSPSAGRLDEDRPHQGAARQRQGRQAGLPEGHLADQHGNRRRGRQARDRRDVQEALRRRLQGRRATGRASRSSPA